MFLLFSDEWLVSEIILSKSTPYILPHLRKKNYSDVECKIVHFDINNTEEKD